MDSITHGKAARGEGVPEYVEVESLTVPGKKYRVNTRTGECPCDATIKRCNHYRRMRIRVAKMKTEVPVYGVENGPEENGLYAVCEYRRVFGELVRVRVVGRSSSFVRAAREVEGLNTSAEYGRLDDSGRAA